MNHYVGITVIVNSKREERSVRPSKAPDKNALFRRESTKAVVKQRHPASVCARQPIRNSSERKPLRSFILFGDRLSLRHDSSSPAARPHLLHLLIDPVSAQRNKHDQEHACRDDRIEANDSSHRWGAGSNPVISSSSARKF